MIEGLRGEESIASYRFQHPTRGRNELWQTDFTYLPVVEHRLSTPDRGASWHRLPFHCRDVAATAEAFSRIRAPKALRSRQCSGVRFSGLHHFVPPVDSDRMRSSGMSYSGGAAERRRDRAEV